MLKFLLVAYYFLLMWCHEKDKERKMLSALIEGEIVIPKKVHQERVYAIDFDNTIAYTKWPTIIKPIPYAMEVLRNLSEDPNCTLILWSCREGKELEEALNFCSAYGVKFDYVNENCERNLKKFGLNCRKVSADVYIDDKSWEGLNGGIERLWKNWHFWLKENGFYD